MREKEELRVGIVGLGKMGLLHMSILSTIPGVKIAAICESKRSLAWFATRMFAGVSVVHSVQAFPELNLDAVFVCTPIPSHFAVINEMYSIGVPNLFVEKTLAANGDEALKICNLAKKDGAVNMVGYMAQFAVTFQKARELLKGDAIGKIASFKAYAYSSDFVGIPEKSFLRGGVIRDLGSHVIDLALWYFGGLEITDATLEPAAPFNAESSAHFKVKGSGCDGEFDISWSREGYRVPEYGLAVTGTGGTIEVNNDRVKVVKGDKVQTWYRMDLNDNVAFLLGAPEYYREDAGFIRAILDKAPAEPDFLAASKVDCLIDEVKRKAGQGAR